MSSHVPKSKPIGPSQAMCPSYRPDGQNQAMCSFQAHIPNQAMCPHQARWSKSCHVPASGHVCTEACAQINICVQSSHIPSWALSPQVRARFTMCKTEEANLRQPLPCLARLHLFPSFAFCFVSRLKVDGNLAYALPPLVHGRCQCLHQVSNT